MEIEKLKNKYILPKWITILFFITGIIAATLMRSIIIFNHVDPDMVRVIWYLGISGYTVFFAFRYHITKKRKEIILKYNIIEKLERREELSEKEKELLEYVLLSVVRSKELINYLYIFVTSFLAIFADLILTVYGL